MVSLENRVVNAVSYVLLLLGIALLMIGFILSDPQQVLAVLLDRPVPPFFEVGVMSVGLSVLSLMTATVGIAGSLKRSTCCLLLFMCFIVLSAVLQAATFSFALRHSGSLKATAASGLLLAMPLYLPRMMNESYSTEFSRKWDFEQEKHECCGVDGWWDWRMNGSFPVDDEPGWPGSCGEHPEQASPPRGCLQYLTNNSYVALILAAVACLALYIPEVLGILSARHAIQTIRKRRKFKRISRSTDAGYYG